MSEPVTIQTIPVPAQQQPDPMPTDPARQGSGVIDPPVTPDENSLVEGMLQAFDMPDAEEIEYNYDPNNLPPEPAPAPLPLGQQPNSIQQAPPATDPAQQVVPQAQPQPVPGAVPGQQAPEQVVQQVVPPQGTVPQQPPQPQAPAAPANVPPQGEPAAQAVPPGQELVALRQAVEAQREQFVQVAAQAYEQSFTESDIEEFQSNPKAGLSKMAARLHADIVQNVLSMVSSQVPRMITNLQTVQTANKEREDAFYAANPDLSAQRAVVDNVARTYRALNPHMDGNTFRVHVAQLARQQIGLTAPVHQPAPQGLPAPAAPQPRAFAPAGSAVPAAAQVPYGQQPVNQWAFTDAILEADANGQFEAR